MSSFDLNNRPTWLLIMGVSGSGKSTVGRAIGTECQLPFVEGDEFHSPDSVAKMRSGVALTDADRSSWLDRLAYQLQIHERGAALSCSALKERYRNRLKAAVTDLKIVYLEIDLAAARSRVAGRSGHLFPAGLVDSQFAALEAPVPGPDVLIVSAMLPTAVLCQKIVSWIHH
jgi:gluconokinase